MNGYSVDDLISNDALYRQFIYTPLIEAKSILSERKDFKWSPKYVPFDSNETNKAFFSVSLITPNYGVSRYVSTADSIELKPFILERAEDRFIPQNNPYKHSLGQLSFFNTVDSNRKPVMEHLNIVDFPHYSGKQISETRTIWNQSLTDFHHALFFSVFPHLSFSENFFDNSKWFYEVGGTTLDYYIALLSLTIRHGILFENFLLDTNEVDFTRSVFLPAFIQVYKETGLKPLIVALEPSEAEGEEFWISQTSTSMNIIFENSSLFNNAILSK